MQNQYSMQPITKEQYRAEKLAILKHDSQIKSTYYQLRIAALEKQNNQGEKMFSFIENAGEALGLNRKRGRVENNMLDDNDPESFHNEDCIRPPSFTIKGEPTN